MVSTGYAHSCALNDNYIYCFGLNNYNQIQLMKDKINSNNRLIKIRVGFWLTEMSAGGQHTCIQNNIGFVHCVGWDH